MKILGITGKIGSGKSLVCTCFLENSKSYVIDCDKIAKKLIDGNYEILEKIKKVFGEDYVKDGILNRKKMRKLVFNNKEELLKLNNIVHEALFDEVKNIVEKLKNDDYEFIIVEAAVLFEAGIYKLTDFVIWVSADIDVVKERVKKRDKDKVKNIESIYKNQINYDDVKEKVDFVLENNSTKQELYKNTLELIKKIRGLK